MNSTMRGLLLTSLAKHSEFLGAGAGEENANAGKREKRRL